MKKHLFSMVTGIFMCAVSLSLIQQTARADININGDNFNPLSWNVDRYAPASFGVVNFGGNNVIGLTVDDSTAAPNRLGGYSSSFYNTQGKSTATATASGSWSFSASLYVSSAMANGTAGPVRPDLWGSSGGGSDYFIIGLLSGTSDPYSVVPFAGASWETWNDVSGTWTASASTVNTGWNTLSVVYDGLTGLDYQVNGATIASLTVDPLVASALDSVYLQDRNYGVGDGNTVYWNNISAVAPVPEPSTLALACLGGFATLVGFRRKR
ncbi:MAG: PEP-CTERM sorting domain-containing protein [Patescibacteria group bacterium]